MMHKSFPNIDKFCSEEGLTSPPKPEPHDEWFLLETAFHDRIGGNPFKLELERDLSFAYQSNALDNDRRARLKSRDSAVYFGILGEFRAGRRLTAGDADIGQWDPVGTNSRVGEFMLRWNSVDVFTEVKTSFGDGDHQLVSRLASKLQKQLYAVRQRFAGVRVTLDITSRQQGVGPYLEGMVIKSISEIAAEVRANGLPQETEFMFLKCSIHVSVQSDPASDGRRIHVMSGGFTDPHEALIRRLNKAAKPTGQLPYLVAVYDFDHWLLNPTVSTGISTVTKDRLTRWLQRTDDTEKRPDAIYIFGDISVTDERNPDGLAYLTGFLTRDTPNGEMLRNMFLELEFESS